MSSGFVTESSIEEKRRLRQEEWEKVRKPDDPQEAPEEEYDPRSLYDRLKEQKDKKQSDWDEAHKLKNLVRGLDDDEADFLEFVDKTRLAEESRILQEERNELEEYRKAVAKENEERLKLEVKSVAHSLPPKSSQLLPSIGVSKESQKSKLNACVVKRKCVATAVCDDSQRSKKIKGISENEALPNSDLKCIAILPGIGCYDDSSSSESSNESSLQEAENTTTQFDLCGRQIDGNDK